MDLISCLDTTSNHSQTNSVRKYTKKKLTHLHFHISAPTLSQKIMKNNEK